MLRMRSYLTRPQLSWGVSWRPSFIISSCCSKTIVTQAASRARKLWTCKPACRTGYLGPEVSFSTCAPRLRA